MPLSSRQQAYLDAMGIPAWSLRNNKLEDIPQVNSDVVSAKPQVILEVMPETIDAAVEEKPDEVVLSRPVPQEIKSWDELQQAVRECTACGLYEQRHQTVFGVGNRQADVMVIGEAPGHDEDLKGEPFVGRAGQLLDAMLASIGLSRESAYIANIVKCRPPNNRDPSAEEAQACSGYLQRQMEWIQPKVIFAVGRVSAHQCLGREGTLSSLRGQIHQHHENGLPVIVTYHPAYLLRRPIEKRKAWDDLKRLRALLQDAS